MATESVTVWVDGAPVALAPGASVMAALVTAGAWCTRRSLSGEPRFALCGIGQCQECRVSINGQPHRLACQVRCSAGMQVVTEGAA